jgi:hypothetical protein
MTLLSKYYREHPDRFTEFVIEATHSHRRMYLFDMVSTCVRAYVCMWRSVAYLQLFRYTSAEVFAFMCHVFVFCVLCFVFCSCRFLLLSSPVSHFFHSTEFIFLISFLLHARIYISCILFQLPSIMPCFDSPNTVLNSCKGELFRRLRLQHGYKAGK